MAKIAAQLLLTPVAMLLKNLSMTLARAHAETTEFFNWAFVYKTNLVPMGIEPYMVVLA